MFVLEKGPLVIAKLRSICLALLPVAVLSACTVDVSLIDHSSKLPPSNGSLPTVESVAILNGNLVMTGENLNTIKRLKIEGKSQEFVITAQTETSLSASATSALALLASGTYQLLVSTASAETVAPISFTFEANSVPLNALSINGVTDRQILQYNASLGSWEPNDLSGINFIATWDATQAFPGGSNNTVGDFYIVSQSGSTPVDGISSWNAGDWILFNGTTWERVANAGGVTSFNGRTGVVVPLLNDNSDVNINTPVNGSILKYDSATEKWIVGVDNVGSGGGTISNAATFTAAGTALTVDNSAAIGGNLAVGTASPSSKFHVSDNTSGNYASRILNTNANGSGLKISGGSTNSQSALQVTGYDELTTFFKIGGDGTAYFNGSVGVGTTTPGAPLDVSGRTWVNGVTAGGLNAGNLATPLLVKSDSVGRGIRLISTDFDNTTNTGSTLMFGLANGSGNSNAEIVAKTAGGSASGNLTLNQGGGNVGIGISAPISKLHIKGGGVSIGDHTGDNGFPYLLMMDKDGTTNAFQMELHGSRMDFLNGNSPNNVVMSLDKSSGNIGLGTSSPNQLFEVSGSVTDFIRMTRTDAVAGHMRLGVSQLGSPAKTSMSIKDETNSIAGFSLPITYVLSTGVGIGTATPAVQLDVAGAIKLGNDATACAAGLAGALRYNSGVIELCDGTAWGGIATAASYVNTSGAQSISGDKSFSGANTYSGASSFTGSATFSNTIGPAVSIGGGGLAVSSGITVSGGGINNSGGGITNSGNITGSSTASANLTLDSTSNGTKGNIILAPTGGNVGIGTTAPGSKLHVAGQEMRLQTDNAYYSWYNTAGTRQGYIQHDSGNGVFFVNEQNTPMQFRTNNLSRLYITNDGNVGIGTTSPSSILDVQAASANLKITSTTGTNRAQLNIQNGTNTTTYLAVEGDTAGSGFGGSLPYATMLGTQDAQPLQLFTSNAARMTIAAGGNVGIGTTVPSSKLEIVSVRSYGDPGLTYEESAISIRGNADEYPSFYAYAFGGTDNYENATVGVHRARGTRSSPTPPLAGDRISEVFGAGYNSTLSDYSYVGAIDFFQTAAATASGNPGAMVFKTNDGTNRWGSERMRITNSGYVGIGTTTPAAPLEVNGAVRADSICDRAGTTCKTASEFTIAPQFAYQGTATSYTGGTTEQTLYSTTIPANTLGPNGVLRISVAFTMTNNANSKKFKIKFGPGGSETTFFDSTPLGSLANAPDVSVGVMIRNRNATNAQVGYVNQGFGPAVKTTGTVDTTAGSNLIITGQLTNGADTMAIESVTVEILK